MKKKLIIISVIVLLMILLIPVKYRIKDGGTIIYHSIIYEIENVNNLEGDRGTIIRILSIEVYNNVKNTSV